MTVPSIHFEAKKHSYRQVQDGIVVSFVVHPNDVNADFAVAPLGTRYMVAVAKIGDDGNPIPPGATTEAAIGSAAADHPPPPERSAIAPGGAKRERTLPEKVGMLCNNPDFIMWAAGERGRNDPEYVAAWVRAACGVTSRRLILPGTEAEKAWRNIETRFLEDTGQLAERRR